MSLIMAGVSSVRRGGKYYSVFMSCPLLVAFAPNQSAGPAPLGRLLFLDAAVGIELADIGPQVVDLLLVLDAGKDHLGAGHLGPRVLDVVLEFRLVPDDAGILVGVRIGEIGHAAGMSAVQPVELRADLVLGVVADGMTGQAFVERNLALGHVLRRCRTGRRSNQRGRYNQRPHNQFSLSPIVPVAPQAASNSRPQPFKPPERRVSTAKIAALPRGLP